MEDTHFTAALSGVYTVLLGLTHRFRPVYSCVRTAPGCLCSPVSWLCGKVLKCGVVCEAAKLQGGLLLRLTGPVWTWDKNRTKSERCCSKIIMEFKKKHIWSIWTTRGLSFCPCTAWAARNQGITRKIRFADYHFTALRWRLDYLLRDF